MGNVVFAFNVVAPLCLTMAIGYILNKIGLIPDSFIPLANRFCFRFCLPVMLFTNTASTDFSSVFNGRLILFGVAAVFVLVPIGMLLALPASRERRRRGVLVQNFYRSNFLLFGVPLAQSMFGATGVGVTSTLIAIIIPIFNLFAVIILSFYGEKKENLKIGKTLLSIVTNPLIIGAAAGLAVVYFNITLPTALSSTVDSIGKIATPLMLMTLGANFRFKAAGKNFSVLLWGVLGRLVIAPLLVLGAGILLGFRSVELGALIAFSASPVAVSSYIMAAESSCDGDLAGQLVVFTSLFSVVTVFFWVFALRSFGFL